MRFCSQDLVMDILRVLTTPDLEVRKKTLQLALDLVSSRNVEEVCVNVTMRLSDLSLDTNGLRLRARLRGLEAARA